MDRLKQLVIEAHRRSLWQVLGVYVLSSWVVLQVADTLTGVFGLPHWVPQFALVLLIIGLPVVMATAVVQEGAAGKAARAGEPGGIGEPSPSPIPPASPEPSFLQRHLNWKRAMLGGVGAFALLGLLVTGYLTARGLGIGPMGSLVAQGTLDEGEAIVLADFYPPTGDPTLGGVATELIRVDLTETPIVRVVERLEIQEILSRMGAGEVELLAGELAREAAIRGGIKALLEGEVARAGSGYVFTATLRHAESGRSLAAFRETARSDDQVIPAIDRLSRRIRERIGESLRTIHASPPMAQVTTASLDALRLYSRADRAFDRRDYAGAMTLLREALELDPDFAMAWRRLAVLHHNMGEDPGAREEAATKAFELRHRLTERERLLATAFHAFVTGDREAEREANRRVLELDPHDPTALHNLGRGYLDRRRFGEAAEFLERGVQESGAVVSHTTLLESLFRSGRIAEARLAMERFERQHPDFDELPLWWFWQLFFEGRNDDARQMIEGYLPALEARPMGRSWAYHLLGVLDMWEGRVGDARGRFAAAERPASEAGPGFRWQEQLFVALAENAMGDPDRAAETAMEAWERGIEDGVPVANRPYQTQAKVLGQANRGDLLDVILEHAEGDLTPEVREFGGWLSVLAVQLVMNGDPGAAISLVAEARMRESCATCWEWHMGWALREAGRMEEAAAEWEHMAELGGQAFRLYPIDHLRAVRKLGPLYEELGDTERALHHYRRLTELWADADPELQPVVERARERIGALGGSAEPGGTP